MKIKQLTYAQLLVEMRSGHPVQIAVRSSKVSHLGYSIVRDYYFASKSVAQAFATQAGAIYFTLYGWDGKNWSTDARMAA